MSSTVEQLTASNCTHLCFSSLLDGERMTFSVAFRTQALHVDSYKIATSNQWCATGRNAISGVSPLMLGSASPFGREELITF